MDLVDLDRRALAATWAYLRATTDDQWALPTPCAGWDVRALVAHVVGNNERYAALATGATVDWSAAAPDPGSDDLVAAFEVSAARAVAAFAAADLTAPAALATGPGTVGAAVAVHFVDILTHGWDLAVATGQDPTLPADLAEAALGIVALYPPEVWGNPRYFAHEVPAPDDAPPHVRLVSRLGRRPNAVPSVAVEA